MRKIILCAAVLAIASSAFAQDPNNPSYMELAVAPRLLTAETANNAGEIGMWEYVYDLYGGGASQLARWGIRGFDAELILNQSPIATGWGGAENVLNQQWNAQAARNNSYSSFYDDFGTMGSYAGTYVNPDRNMNGDPNEWVVPPTCRVGDVGLYGIINTWHTPSDYVYVSFAGTKQAGVLTGIGGPVEGVQFNASTSSNEIDGLFHTFRIVHPNAPGEIEWWSYSFNPGTGTTASGTILGPGAGSGPPPGDFDDDGDVDVDDINALCANMTGDGIPLPVGSEQYDLDSDGDADSDDMNILIHDLVETTVGIGTEYGDFNLDGTVDTVDLTILGTYFGVGTSWSQGNANCDTTVDTVDLTILGTYFGFVAASPIPEPATMSLLVLGGLAALKRRS